MPVPSRYILPGRRHVSCRISLPRFLPGSSVAFDRVLATRFGVKAVDMLVNKELGKMACLKGNEIGSVDLKEATSSSKPITPDLYQVAELFFG